jgi:biopolymer transport protein ExbD
VTKRRKGDPSSEVILPITPMLDMAFQLLMFFIITYHPSALEGEMDLAMAKSKTTTGAPSIAAPTNKDDDLQKDDKDELNVRVQLKGDNKYVITLEEKTNAIDKQVVGTPMDDRKQLRDTLAVKFKSRAEKIKQALKDALEKDPKLDQDKFQKEEIKKASINVQGDRALKMGSVIEVMDDCRQAADKAFKEAGFDAAKHKISVNFGAPPEVGK